MVQSDENLLSPSMISKYMGSNIFCYWLLYTFTGGLYFFFFQHRFNTLAGKLKMGNGVFGLKLYLTISVLSLIAPCVYLLYSWSRLDTLNFDIDSPITVMFLSFILGSIAHVLWCFKARRVYRDYITRRYFVRPDVNTLLMLFLPGTAFILAFNALEAEIAIGLQSRRE